MTPTEADHPSLTSAQAHTHLRSERSIQDRILHEQVALTEAHGLRAGRSTGRTLTLDVTGVAV